MQTRFGAVWMTLAAACVLSAQNAPSLSGVWKLNTEKSKTAQPLHGSQIIILEQDGTKITETVGQFRPDGSAYRQVLKYDLGGTEAMNTQRGVPYRTTGSVEGGSAVVNWKGPGAHPSTIREKYTVSPDGQTLTVERSMTNGEKSNTDVLVFDKQPDSAAEPLRGAEKKASEVYKNVKLLGDVPASRLIDAMYSFSMSLGQRCDFCHEEGNFAADTKPAKEMARRMMVMTRNINQSTFDGKMEVRCYTCHRGQAEPQSMPR